jgi:1-acyl-sn-glycerol-3-phosphate acyltransferase
MRLFSAAYWTFIALTCIPFFVLALALFVVTVPFDRRRVVLHLYSCFWAVFYIHANPLWSLRVIGREKLPWRGPAVIVANHASLIDILTLFALYRPFKWVSKASVFRVPLIGWNMKLNDYVGLVRGNRTSILRMMEECRVHLRRGCPVLLFPEGTRTKTGELQDFKDGAFRLAVEMKCPVIPIAVHGTADSLPKHGFVLRNRMRGIVEVLDPIDPGDLRTGALRDATRSVIADALGRRRGRVSGTAPEAAQAGASRQEGHLAS